MSWFNAEVSRVNSIVPETLLTEKDVKTPEQAVKALKKLQTSLRAHQKECARSAAFYKTRTTDPAWDSCKTCGVRDLQYQTRFQSYGPIDFLPEVPLDALSAKEERKLRSELRSTLRQDDKTRLSPRKQNPQRQRRNLKSFPGKQGRKRKITRKRRPEPLLFPTTSTLSTEPLTDQLTDQLTDILTTGSEDVLLETITGSRSSSQSSRSPNRRSRGSSSTNSK